MNIAHKSFIPDHFLVHWRNKLILWNNYWPQCWWKWWMLTLGLMRCLFILFFLAGGISIWCGGFQCESINLLDYWKHISCDVSLITTFQYFNLILHMWPLPDLRKFDFLCVHNCIRNCQIHFSMKSTISYNSPFYSCVLGCQAFEQEWG